MERLTGLPRPVPLRPDHRLAAFDCGEPALDDWLEHRALRNESRFSRTFVVCDGDRVVAYYCISAGAVAREAAPAQLRRNAPDPVTVTIIGRLAVDKSYAGAGLGTGLLADALRRIARASRSIGIAAVLVQAKTEAAKRFYLACAEFVEYRAESRTLFLRIDAVTAFVE